MEEYRRFFRYVIPGLIFIIELSIFLFLSDLKDFKDFILKLISDRKVDGSISIGVAIIAFLTTGGLGYLFGIIYHTVFHIIRKIDLPYFRVNHLSVINYARENGWIILKNYENNKELQTSEQLTQSGAWRIVISFWNGCVETSEIIKGAEPRSKSFADILHGTGTNIIASFTAIFIWIALLLSYNVYPEYNALLKALLIAIFLFSIHIFNYLFVVRDYQGNINGIIAYAMEDAFKKAKKRPTEIFVSSNDFFLNQKKR